MYTFMAHSVRTPLKHVSSSRYTGMYLTQLVFSTSLLCPGSCDYTSTVTTCVYLAQYYVYSRGKVRVR